MSSQSSPPSFRRADILKLLDIAESAAKMVPVLGNLLEGGIRSLRKILDLVDVSYLFFKRGRLMKSNLAVDEDLQIGVILNLFHCLLEIEEYMRILSHAAVIHSTTSSSALLTEIANFNVKKPLSNSYSFFDSLGG
ncbi:hypothetical protein C8J56DRAFT_1166981 [Mycena floridula]|nr:hypothetical protein C8J56DRAFT_1166981 [Mycena floridula]